MLYSKREAWAEFWRRQIGVWIAAGSVTPAAGMAMIGLVDYVDNAWTAGHERLTFDYENGYGGAELPDGRAVNFADAGALLIGWCDEWLPYYGEWAEEMANYLFATKA